MISNPRRLTNEQETAKKVAINTTGIEIRSDIDLMRISELKEKAARFDAIRNPEGYNYNLPPSDTDEEIERNIIIREYKNAVGRSLMLNGESVYNYVGKKHNMRRSKIYKILKEAGAIKSPRRKSET